MYIAIVDDKLSECALLSVISVNCIFFTIASMYQQKYFSVVHSAPNCSYYFPTNADNLLFLFCQNENVICKSASHFDKTETSGIRKYNTI